MYFSLEYCGVEPQAEAMSPFWSPIYTLQHKCLYWCWPGPIY